MTIGVVRHTRRLAKIGLVGLMLCACSPGHSDGVVAMTANGYPHPNPILTPGAAIPGVTAAQVCKPGYAKSVRNVSSATKREIFTRYGTVDTPGTYEVDHLISLELGGSNDVGNLWPEPYTGTHGAHAKDAVENRLHGEVCSGKLPLAEAQKDIATSWWTAP